ncbi:Plant methyltransferase dimerization domain - like 1 [Theobroma cacao]|nr:Plant methyltransferase dimerization domain - like 1 [Theobroma cacao]
MEIQLEIIAKAGPGCLLSAAEIVSNLPTKNPDAPTILDPCNRVTDKDGHTKGLYGIGSIGKYFLQNEDGISVIPLLNVALDKHSIECWGFGMDFFEMAAKDNKVFDTFNQAVSSHTLP